MTRILIATSNSALATDVRELLSSGGFHTALVSDLDQMVTCCLERQPEMALIDFDLPGGSLWTVTKALRSDARSARTVFIGLTAGTDPNEKQHALMSGFAAIESKPVEPARLAQTIQANLPASPSAASSPGGNITPINENQTDNLPSPGTMHPVTYLQSLSTEVLSLAEQIKPRVTELGTEGPELFGYIEGSGNEIREKLQSLAVHGLDTAEQSLRDREIRHDFRNMIGSVSGFSELLLMDPDIPEDLRPLFTRIREYCRVFVELLDQEKAAAAA